VAAKKISRARGLFSAINLPSLASIGHFFKFSIQIFNPPQMSAEKGSSSSLSSTNSAVIPPPPPKEKMPKFPPVTSREMKEMLNTLSEGIEHRFADISEQVGSVKTAVDAMAAASAAASAQRAQPTIVVTGGGYRGGRPFVRRGGGGGGRGGYGGQMPRFNN
jgi:hypothetical protein